MGGLIDEVLGDAQHRGFLGSGEIDQFVLHALGYLEGLEDVAAIDTGADLGPGGGIPGLVLAVELPGTRWHLIERSRGRADWLTRAVVRLGMSDRVAVHHEAAELTGRGRLRRSCDVVVARRFAAPAVAAECTAPLLRIGGRAVFSDLQGPSGPLSGADAPSGPLSGADGPSGPLSGADAPSGQRWDEEKLATLGLAMVRTWTGELGTYVMLEQQVACPERFPRSPGVPARRPLF